MIIYYDSTGFSKEEEERFKKHYQDKGKSSDYKEILQMLSLSVR